jgi:hypothetical protein
MNSNHGLTPVSSKPISTVYGTELLCYRIINYKATELNFME